MNTKQKRSIADRIHNRYSAWIILCLSIGLTIAAYVISDRNAEKNAQAEFEHKAIQVTDAIKDRMELYEQVLWSGAALFASTDNNVTRNMWNNFVYKLDLNKNWPGIQGMGFSIPVTPKEKNKHIQQIRNQGFPKYTITPTGEREKYSAIIYLEPFDWRNQRAFGYDMWSNPIRRAAMRHARDNGVAATSGMITLVQETNKDRQKGFLCYVPVYQKKETPESLEDRRKSFIGWVYAPFRIKDFINGISEIKKEDIKFEIYDDVTFNSETLMFDSDDKPHFKDNDQSPVFSKTMTINFPGKTWTLYFSSVEEKTLFTKNTQTRLIAAAGIIIDILLFYVIFSLSFIDKKAETLAREKTIALQESKEQLLEQVNSRTIELQKARKAADNMVVKRTQELQQKINELEILNEATMGREIRIVELKKEVNTLSEKLGVSIPYPEISGSESDQK